MSGSVSLYTDKASLYDVDYLSKDYAVEATFLQQLICNAIQYSPAEKPHLLDVACGTGNHLQFLQEMFVCTGIDLNSSMLAIAKQKIPQAIFQQADMTNFDLAEKFDVIICLFSSLYYLLDTALITRTLQMFVRHLTSNGMIIIEPWLTPDKYEEGKCAVQANQTANVSLTRLSVSRRQRDVALIDMYYTVYDGKNVTSFQDTHAFLLLPHTVLQGIFDSLGYATEVIMKAPFQERGLIVAKAK